MERLSRPSLQELAGESTTVDTVAWATTNVSGRISAEAHNADEIWFYNCNLHPRQNADNEREILQQGDKCQRKNDGAAVWTGIRSTNRCRSWLENYWNDTVLEKIKNFLLNTTQIKIQDDNTTFMSLSGHWIFQCCFWIIVLLICIIHNF
jgi:hypothetical protein